MPTASTESPRHIPIQECNVGNLQRGDVVTVPRVDQIDRAAIYLGTQMMVLCGGEPVFDPDHPGLFGNQPGARGKFQPLSHSLLLGMEEPLVRNARLHMVTPVLGFNARGVLQAYFSAGFIAAVDLHGSDTEPHSVLTQNIQLLGYPQKVRLQRNAGATNCSPDVLAGRVEKYNQQYRQPTGDSPTPESVEAVNQLIANSQGLFNT